MSPLAKAVLSVLRLLAFGCIILGLALYSSDFYLYLSHRPVSGRGLLLLKGLPALVGLVLAGKSRALAERLTRDWE